uniref:Uncharacterized protein n=1 Tax=Salix viminalis TaxID=40686 RepID=A0A6N2LUH9_SALVM
MWGLLSALKRKPFYKINIRIDNAINHTRPGPILQSYMHEKHAIFSLLNLSIDSKDPFILKLSISVYGKESLV